MKYILPSLLLTVLCLNHSAHADSFYTLQLHAKSEQHSPLSQYLSLPIMHSESFGEGQDFIYLGSFSSEQQAQNKLQQLHEQQPQLKSYRPSIVELFTANKITSAHTPTATAKENTKPLSAEKNYTPNKMAEPAPTGTAGPIYTVALAAFEYEERLLSFIQKYSSNNLYCRQKNNGLYAVYWGIFNSYEHAKQGRSIAQKIPDIQPYIVKFNDNDLSNCNTY